MPVGAGLREAIRASSFFKESGYGDKILSDRVLHQCLQQKFSNTKDFYLRLDALQIVHAGIHLADSIDSFIDLHSSNSTVSEIGKLTIIHSISSAETKSTLFVSRKNIYNKLDLTGTKLSESWFVKFARILFREPNRRTYKASQVIFRSFASTMIAVLNFF